MQKITIDTNILVYYINKSGEFNKQATDILQNSKYKKYITTKTISEFCVVMTKYKVEWNNIIKYIEEIINISTILYPTQNSLEKLRQLCTEYKPHRNQIFDMEIASIMLTNNIKTIATFNHKDFQNINEIRILENCF